jgi:hypothetical protein
MAVGGTLTKDQPVGTVIIRTMIEVLKKFDPMEVARRNGRDRVVSKRVSSVV